MIFEEQVTLEYTELTLDSEATSLWVDASARGLSFLAKNNIEESSVSLTLTWQDATALILTLLVMWERWTPDQYREPKAWQILDPP